jgi:hypothetical protein
VPRPQQRTLDQEVTPHDIVAQALAHLAQKTHTLGDGALAVVMGSRAAIEGLKRLDEAALSGDVARTRRVAREVVKEILALCVEEET